MLRLFNTLTRKKEKFIPVNESEAKIYTCGPSVYDRSHIGNFRTFIFEDVLVRYFKYKGFQVKWVMNITDVEDKAIKKAQEAGKPLHEFTGEYIDGFFEDIQRLNLLTADAYPRVSDHIPQIVDFIRGIVNNGYGYEKEGTVYLDISKFKSYGKLSRLKLKKGKKRIKRDEWGIVASDFALWKSYEKKDGDVYWETDLGKGRPGWHIECSVLSTEYLGQKFDIQMGGVDLIFPHHENTIVQNLGAYNMIPANYWLHTRHLIVNGKKMSKTLGNYYAPKDLIDMGFDPKAVRFVLLTAPYRRRLDFSIDKLKKAEDNVKDIERLIKNLGTPTHDADNVELDKDVEKIITKTRKKFLKAIEDNLDTQKALQILLDFADYAKRLDIRGKGSKRILAAFKDMDYVLGLGLF